jgi:fumarate reductase subunit C
MFYLIRITGYAWVIFFVINFLMGLKLIKEGKQTWGGWIYNMIIFLTLAPIILYAIGVIGY